MRFAVRGLITWAFRNSSAFKALVGLHEKQTLYSKVVNISVFKMIARVSSVIEHSVESFTRNQIKVFISFVRGRTSDVSHLLMVFFLFQFLWFDFSFVFAFLTLDSPQLFLSVYHEGGCGVEGWKKL